MRAAVSSGNRKSSFASRGNVALPPFRKISSNTTIEVHSMGTRSQNAPVRFQELCVGLLEDGISHLECRCTCSACTGSHDGDDGDGDLDDGDGCGLIGGRDHDDLPVAGTVLNIWRFAFPGKERPSQTTWAFRFFFWTGGRLYVYCRVSPMRLKGSLICCSRHFEAPYIHILAVSR